MELVDVADSKSAGGDTMWVRVPPPAPAQRFPPPFRFRLAAKTALWWEFLRFRPGFASLDSGPRKRGTRVWSVSSCGERPAEFSPHTPIFPQGLGTLYQKRTGNPAPARFSWTCGREGRYGQDLTQESVGIPASNCFARQKNLTRFARRPRRRTVIPDIPPVRWSHLREGDPAGEYRGR